MNDLLRFKREELVNYVVRYMDKLGVPKDDVRIVGDVLIEADCCGVSSHGLIRLASYYGHRLKNKYMDPLTPVTVVKETPKRRCSTAATGAGRWRAIGRWNSVSPRPNRPTWPW